MTLECQILQLELELEKCPIKFSTKEDSIWNLHMGRI